MGTVFLIITIIIAVVELIQTHSKVKNHRPDADRWIKQSNANFSKLKELQYKQY